MIDLSKLNYIEFEQLCGRLLKWSGFTILEQKARSQDIGVDFTFSDDQGGTWVA